MTGSRIAAAATCRITTCWWWCQRCSFRRAIRGLGEGEERLLQELSLGGRLATPVNLIVHTYQDVNDQLAQGRPFFVDIARDGIVLQELAGFPFAAPKPLTEEERRAEAARNFEHCFPMPSSFRQVPPSTVDRGNLGIAAFELHPSRRAAVSLRPAGADALQPEAPRLTKLRSQAESVDAG